MPGHAASRGTPPTVAGAKPGHAAKSSPQPGKARRISGGSGSAIHWGMADG